MDRIWYIKINGKKEGPFSIREMKYDRRITPDTPVWKEGFIRWLPARKVPELKIIFSEDDSSSKQDEEGLVIKPVPQGELTLDMGLEPPYFFWLLAALIILAYVLFQLYWFP